METKTYEVCPAFGWGIDGRESSCIRRLLRKHGLENQEPLRFTKINELIAPYPVKVTGSSDAIDAFKEDMKLYGYDDRSS